MWRNVAILAALCVLMCAPLLVMIATTEAEMRAEAAAEQLISDKPMEVAVEAVEAAEEAEREAEEEYRQAAEDYPQYVYYENSYWYKSDDAEAEAEAKEWIAQRESGGDYEARNGQYVGRYQLNEMYLDGDYSEENQEAAAEAYIADRYGSWQAAQEHHEQYGWY